MTLRGRKQITHQFSNRLSTAPATEPVLLADLKLYLRYTLTDQDDYLIDLITTARLFIESVTGFAFITQEWQMTMDNWPGQRDDWWDGSRVGSINELYGMASPFQFVQPTKYPLQSVDTLTVYDESSNATSVTVADKFDVDTQSWPGRLVLKRGETWPIALRALNAIEFVYTAGFGDTASDVPENFKQAIIMMAGYMFNNRGNACCAASNAYGASGAANLISAFEARHI